MNKKSIIGVVFALASTCSAFALECVAPNDASIVKNESEYSVKFWVLDASGVATTQFVLNKVGGGSAPFEYVNVHDVAHMSGGSVVSSKVKDGVEGFAFVDPKQNKISICTLIHSALAVADTKGQTVPAFKQVTDGVSETDNIRLGSEKFLIAGKYTVKYVVEIIR